MYKRRLMLVGLQFCIFISLLEILTNHDLFLCVYVLRIFFTDLLLK